MPLNFKFIKIMFFYTVALIQKKTLFNQALNFGVFHHDIQQKLFKHERHVEKAKKIFELIAQFKNISLLTAFIGCLPILALINFLVLWPTNKTKYHWNPFKFFQSQIEPWRQKLKEANLGAKSHERKTH